MKKRVLFIIFALFMCCSAHADCTIQYNCGTGASGNVPANQSVTTETKTFTVAEPGTCAKTGYVFSHWLATSGTPEVAADGTVKPGATYTIPFIANDATCASNDLTLTLVGQWVDGSYTSVATSKSYTDTQINSRQPKFAGDGNDKLMLYSNTTDGATLSRDIVTTLGSGTSDTTVSTVGAINTGLNTKQDALNATSGWVAEHTGVEGAIAPKPVYSTTDNYENALIDAATLNSAIVNAVNSELTVIPGVGWRINTANDIATLSTPRTYIGSVPDGYTQLEYLESSGTQYIDLGQPIGSGEEITATFAYVNDNPSWWFGAIDGSDYAAPGFFFSYPTAAPKQLVLYAKNVTSSNAFYRAQQDCELYVPYTLNWYGTLAKRPTLSPYIGFTKSNALTQSIYLYTPEHNAALFGVRRGSNGVSRATLRIYHFKVQGKMNLVPARRNSDNVLGMYDTVTNTFFRNKGSGTFGAGPAVGSN